MAESYLKQRIGSGEEIIGANVSMTSTADQLSRVVESDKFDFLWVDSQHSAFSEDRLVKFCERADTLDTNVMFRCAKVDQSGRGLPFLRSERSDVQYRSTSASSLPGRGRLRPGRGRAAQGFRNEGCFRNYDPEVRQKYVGMGITVFLESPVL